MTGQEPQGSGTPGNLAPQLAGHGGMPAAGQNGQQPVRLELTLARWKNRRHRTKGFDGEPYDRWSKVLAHEGPYSQFSYGTDTPSDWQGRLQMAIICSPQSRVIAIDVDSWERLQGTPVGLLLAGHRPVSVRQGGERRHYLIDARSVPADQWPAQHALYGDDGTGHVKSNGFIPVPGSEHYTGELYEPVLGPRGTTYIIPNTPELIAAILEAVSVPSMHGPAGGNGGNGTGGGHDGEIAAAVLSMVLSGLTKEQCYAEWVKIAIPRDPGWPFTADDFERHYRTAAAKAGKIQAEDQQIAANGAGWAQSTAQAPPAPGNQQSTPLHADTVSAAAITMKRVRWLWDHRVPCGELTLAAGREGTAKSQFTIWLAACVTKGTLPGEWQGKPRAVIICAREDSWEHTIKPRLWAAGADLSLVYRVKARNIHSGKSFDLVLPENNGTLSAEITRLRASLVIFDPLLSVMGGKVNTHRAKEVREAIEPLADMAHETGCAMLGLAHFNKSEGKDAASRILDSTAFKDLARSILVFAMDAEADTGVMSHVKSNLGRKQPSLSYQVGTTWLLVSDGTAEVAYYIPGGVTKRHVEDMLDAATGRELARAKDFLLGALTIAPWRLSKELEDEARHSGISSRTLDRARLDLGLKSHRAKDGQWWISTQ